MLALRAFLGEVSGKNPIPMADVLGSIEDSKSEIPGAALFHMSIAVFELPGLVGRRRKSSVGQQLIRRPKPGKVADLGKYHSSHSGANARDSGNRRMQLIHDSLDCSLNFINFGV